MVRSAAGNRMAMPSMTKTELRAWTHSLTVSRARSGSSFAGQGFGCMARSSSVDQRSSALKTKPMTKPRRQGGAAAHGEDDRHPPGIAARPPVRAGRPAGGEDGGDEKAHEQSGTHHDPAHDGRPGQRHGLQQHGPADSTIMAAPTPTYGAERREGGARRRPVQRTASGSGRSGADQESAHHKSGGEHQREPDGEAQRPDVDGIPEAFPYPNATPGDPALVPRCACAIRCERRQLAKRPQK